MQREAAPEDVSMAGSALANVNAAGLGIDLRPWQEALARTSPQMVWDLGCNVGRYSIMAARYANYVVAMDSDEAAVVEFVPKSDPMVQALLRTRQDVYSGYTESAFEEALREHFRITDVARLPNSGRILYLFCSK